MEQKHPFFSTIARLFDTRASVFGCLAAGIGIFNLAGWSIGNLEMLALAPGVIATQPMTAVCLLLFGVALIALGPHDLPHAKAGAAVLAAVVLLTAIATLAEYGGADLGIERLLYPIRVLEQPATFPFSGRSAQGTALLFVVAATAFFGLAFGGARGRRLASWLAVAGLAFCAVIVAGHLSGSPALMGLGFSVAVGLYAAAGLAALFAGLRELALGDGRDGAREDSSGPPVWLAAWLATTRRLPAAVRYTATAAILATALWAHVAVPLLGVFKFLLFFPATTLCALLFGRRVGYASVLMATVLVRWFLMEPRYSLDITDPETGFVVISFLLSQFVMVALIGGALHLFDRVAASEAELRRSEARLRDVIEKAPFPIMVHADDGTVVLVNKVWLDRTGYSRDQLPTTGAWSALAYGEHREGAVASPVHEGERTVTTAGGGPRVWTLSSASLGPGPDGRRLVVSMAADVTERKALEEQLRQAQKMEAVGQLTSGVAHDLNNSLAVISVNVDLLNLVTADNPKATRHIDAALHGVWRAAALTRKLLDFSRTDAGVTHRVQLNEFVTGMEDLIAKSLTPAIALKIVQSEQPWSVDINPADFEAALVNLALNARDAIPNGGTLIVETANKVLDEFYVARNPGSSVGEFVMVSVSDTGTGMTPDVAARAFEPFFTTKDVGKGTGLGLSMVYGFVRRSGGHVTIYSEPGEGSTVRLYLPRTGGEARDAKGRPADRANLPHGEETILVVDDEDMLVETAATVLAALGYRILTAADGRRALDILTDDPSIDLLFSDVVMPNGMDGFRLAMEALKTRPELKVLLTSGFSRKRQELVEGERAIGADLARDLLPKPYNIAELANAVRRTLDRATETSG